MCSPSSSWEPSKPVGRQEKKLICAASHMTPTRACWPQAWSMKAGLKEVE